MFKRSLSLLRLGLLSINSINLKALRGLTSTNTNLFNIHSKLRRELHSYSFADGSESDVLYKTITIELKGHELAVMKSYEQFLTMAANELDINICKVWSPPRSIRRWTLLKSVHIYRKHMVQYETRTAYRVVQLKNLTGSTANTFLEYIQRNLPEGMAMKVTRESIEPLPDHLLKT